MIEILKLNILISFAATLAFVVHMAPNWRFPRFRLLMLVLLIYFTWCLWVLSTMLFPDFEVKIFFTKIRQVLNPFLLPLWWSIIQRVFYPEFWRKNKFLLGLFYLVPAVSAVLTVLSLLGVSWAENQMAYGFTGPDLASGLLHYKSGPWLRFQFLYSSVMLLMLTGTYLINVFNRDSRKRNYAYIFLLATVLVVPLELYSAATPTSIDNQLMAGCSWVFIGVIFWGMSRFEFFNMRPSALRKILDEIPNPVLVWNIHGILWEANEAAARLFHFSAKDLGEKALFFEIRNKLDRGEVYEMDGREFEVHRHEHAYVLTEVSEINEVNRTLKAVNQDLLGVNRDIHRVQKTLAHDLAHAVQEIAVQISAHVPQGPGREQLQISSRSAAEILSSTLSWIKGQNVAVDAKKILHQSLGQLQYGLQGRKVDLNLPPESIFIRGEEFLVQTVFRNIISNAIKHSNDGSPVELALFAQAPNRVIFRCRDLGFGFSKESAPGVGLSLVQDALFDLGATLEIHPQEKGSLVEVVFIQGKESDS